MKQVGLFRAGTPRQSWGAELKAHEQCHGPQSNLSSVPARVFLSATKTRGQSGLSDLLTALNIHHSNQIIGRNLYPSKRGLLIWKRFISPVWVSNLQATKPLPRFLWWSSSYIAKIQHQNDLLLFLPAGCKTHEDDQLLLNLPLLKRTAVHLRWMLVETLNCFSLPLWAMEAFQMSF